MPERFKTEKYEDRPSSKLGPMEYIAKHVLWGLAPLVGFGVGLLLKIKTKIPMLDSVGLSIGGMVAAYHLWGSNKKQQLEIDQLTTDITALRAMESPNTYLQRENQQLREQLSFTDRRPARAGSFADHVVAQSESPAEMKR